MAPPAAEKPTFEKPLSLPIAPEELERINAYLRDQTPEDILAWAVEHVPGLFQTTAFGLTGLVAIDMLSRWVRRRRTCRNLGSRSLCLGMLNEDERDNSRTRE